MSGTVTTGLWPAGNPEAGVRVCDRRPRDVHELWSVLLAWGALKPTERRDLLLITSGFLLLSIIIEFVFFSNMLGGTVFVFGVTKRLVLSVLFTWAYLYSLKTQGR